MKRHRGNGFTVIELLVVIAIIGALMAILLATFNDARQAARDDARQADLKELQLAIELHRAQEGSFPEPGCHGYGSFWVGPGPHSASWGRTCPEYISGLTPDYISELPLDPVSENDDNIGFIYRSDGNAYKLMVHRSVETKFITSFADEFARCPSISIACPSTAAIQDMYAVYSVGAEDW